MKDRGQVALRTVCLRLVLSLELCWCQGWPVMGGQTLSWPFLCTLNSSGLSGYRRDSMLKKEIIWVPRINCLLGIHTWGFLRQNAEDFSKILAIFPSPFTVHVCACLCTCVRSCVQAPAQMSCFSTDYGLKLKLLISSDLMKQYLALMRFLPQYK